MTSTDQYVYLTSRNRVSGTNSNFKVDIDDFSSNMSRAYKMSIKSVSFPNIFYNVTATKNTFTFGYLGSDHSVSVAVGQYNTTQLISALQTEINSIASISIVQDPINLKLSFSGDLIQYYNRTKNPMASLLGILDDSLGEVANFTAQGIPNLSGIPVFFLQSHALSNTVSLVGNLGRIQPVIEVIQNTACFGSIIHHRPSDGDLSTINYNCYNNLTNIDIFLTDEYGNEVDLQGHEMIVCMKVYFE